MSIGSDSPRVSGPPLRIAHIAPVATAVPPPKSGSVELMTSLLTEGLVARGHDVTLFATADSITGAKLHAIYEHGYWHDENMWPWELYEMLNLAAGVERASDFDIIHYEAAYYPMSLAFARLSPTPIVQTLHHSPSEAEIALWSRYPEAAFVAISKEQARLLNGLTVVDTVLHGIDTDSFAFRKEPEDYLLFLGRFTDGKGVLQAIEVARRVGMRLILAAAEDEYYREKVAPHVDGTRVIYHGEADHPTKVKLYGGARALLYPIQAREPFGLVLAEAMACGTPVAALDRGAVREVVDEGVTGIVFDDLEQMVNELPRVFDLDRRRVREQAVARFGVVRMVDEYIAVYRRLIAAHRGHRDVHHASRGDVRQAT
jgi:glycosyltransferase involved in cell wall biosynthesis